MIEENLPYRWWMLLSMLLVSLFGSSVEATKETFTVQGTNYAPEVSIVDASAGAGGLLEITVTIEEATLKTLKADY